MTAPRWQDAREHAMKLLREERDSLTAELPRIESIDERELFDAWLARVDLALTTIGAIDDAALARLAEPTTAAERWRAVPADVRRIVLRWVERGQAQAHRDNVDAYHALAALAREAERSGG